MTVMVFFNIMVITLYDAQDNNQSAFCQKSPLPSSYQQGNQSSNRPIEI